MFISINSKRYVTQVCKSSLSFLLSSFLNVYIYMCMWIPMFTWVVKAHVCPTYVDICASCDFSHLAYQGRVCCWTWRFLMELVYLVSFFGDLSVSASRALDCRLPLHVPDFPSFYASPWIWTVRIPGATAAPQVLYHVSSVQPSFSSFSLSCIKENIEKSKLFEFQVDMMHIS